MAFSALMQELILPVSKEGWMGIVLVTLGINRRSAFQMGTEGATQNVG